jgi:cellulose synthase/poly-beta-1,6-N-acetylglucosamine synthase-like glycosyltransferase
LDQQCAVPFEVIVVDDHSTDDTAGLVKGLAKEGIRLVKLSDLQLDIGEVAYKKRAIEEGVRQSRGEIIVTTDADCRHHPGWLQTIADAFTGDTNMVSGPVLFDYDDSVFQQFQALDFIGMIGITAASLQLGMFNLANGANLAFRRQVFNEVKGYAGIDSRASGDDMLLIYKFAQKDPASIRFLKSTSAVVYTRPAAGLQEFIQQRLRWTSKSFSYQDKRITWILAFVYLANILYPFLLISAILTGDVLLYLLLAFQVLCMFTVDFLFLKRVTAFFGRQKLMRSFISSQLLHIVYIIVIGMLGNLVKYRWKGRKLT